MRSIHITSLNKQRRRIVKKQVNKIHDCYADVCLSDEDMMIISFRNIQSRSGESELNAMHRITRRLMVMCGFLFNYTTAREDKQENRNEYEVIR